jgi:hypothetical protein
MPDPACSIEVEDLFGPIVASSCLHGFDFTLLFEECIFTLLPLALVSLAALIRIWKLHSASEKVNRSWSYAMKEVCGQFSKMSTFYIRRANMTSIAIVAPVYIVPYNTFGSLESPECRQNKGDYSDHIVHYRNVLCLGLLISP